MPTIEFCGILPASVQTEQCCTRANPQRSISHTYMRPLGGQGVVTFPRCSFRPQLSQRVVVIFCRGAQTESTGTLFGPSVEPVTGEQRQSTELRGRDYRTAQAGL
jgi:hypothetical protein